ncbi:MAG: BREX system P-loop protein BrxC [Chloroflexi bacterium]|nr:BREX system P-loop protein BrxC [Chloroflexota bacterium]
MTITTVAPGAAPATPSATIRSLFSTRRPIDRPIEKVIDYYAADEQRLRAEVEEYEVTENVEHNFRRFLDVFGAGVRAGQVTETGIWVSGFYGSGKSSFTKYLGFALDPERKVGDRPFLDLLAERINAVEVRQELKTLAAQYPVAVIMLDLGAEQLASSSVASVSTVLYWKVLQWAGYSKEEKLAQLEFRLDKEDRLDAFRRAYTAKFGDRWEEVHDDPLIGVSRAAQLAPVFFPQEFPQPEAFSRLRFSLAGDVRDRAAEILDLVRRKTGRQNVLFLIDEVGQYVAPRGELILNLDGLARNFKELGQGRVWIVATGQQTLAEIVQRAAYNSAELNKLRDRFPIPIELDASDIREITWRRLLTKSAAGQAQLAELFRRHGQALAIHTRLSGTSLFKGDPDEQSFVRLYPFLPQHFSLLMELVRNLARSRGGIGLRSAIRVIQDVLVDTSKALPLGTNVLADQPVGHLGTADQFFDTLRADIGKELRHVLVGVDRVAKVLPGDELALRAAKAVGALQPVEHFPRTVENIAALLYRRVGDPPHVDAVRGALRRLVEAKEVGLVEDPQAGGFTFLSEGVKPLREERDRYLPTTAEISQLRSHILKSLFDSPPSITLEGAKTVRAGVRLGRVPITGENEEVQFALEITDGANWEGRREELLTVTTGHAEWKTAVAWLIRPDGAVEQLLVEAAKSKWIEHKYPETEADRDVAQFIRSERRAGEKAVEDVQTLYRNALKAGTLIFRGNPTPAGQAGDSVAAAARKVLQEAAATIYPSFRLVNIRPGTDLAAKVLAVERLDRMPSDLDPLGFVTKSAGRPRVDAQHPALAEALRAFKDKLSQQGTPRLQGNAVQDIFAAAPYGWSKDATRYVFAALLVAGEVVFHTSSGLVQTAGPAAVESVRTTQAFGRIGVGLRDGRPSMETLDRASSRLESLLGQEVLPLEDNISRAPREYLPARLAEVGSLPDQLRLLNLAGVDRAQTLKDTGAAILQGDGAIAVLGAVDCTFPNDLAWAEQSAKALAGGAEADVRAARDVLRDADDLAQLFPAYSLVEQSERDTLYDVLASETFHTQLPDLRATVRQLRDRAAQRYRETWAAHQADLDGIKAALEALPEWVEIGEDDRQEIVLRLGNDQQPAPPDKQEINALKMLLVRRGTLPGLRQDLEREVERRIPPPEIDDGKDGQPVDLELSAIAPPTVIHTDTDLEAWLNTLRAAVANALSAGAPVRIRVRS